MMSGNPGCSTQPWLEVVVNGSLAYMPTGNDDTGGCCFIGASYSQDKR